MRTRRNGAPRAFACMLVTVTLAACGSQPQVPAPPKAGTAGLLVTVTGLPATVDARVTVTLEGAVIAEVGETVTLTNLAPGDYTVVAEEVGDGAVGVYVPDPPQAVVRLEADEDGSARVEYLLQDPTLGSLKLAIDGLPFAADALVDVVHPGGDRVRIVTSSTLRDLPPGEYLVEASPVAPDSATFTPSAAAQAVAVTAGGVSDAAVVYRCATVKPPDFQLERAIRDMLQIASGAVACSDLAALTTLYAGGYGIADPTLDGLQYAPELTFLDLADNSLEVLDINAFASQSKLETLYLSNNQLTEIAAGTFSHQGTLKELALDYNSFASLEAGSLAGLTSLKWLSLEGNALSVVPDRVFAEVPLLESLNLRANGLTEVTSGLFAGLPELQSLDLGANDIVTVGSGGFSGLAKLRHLDLSYNELTEMLSGWAADLSGLEFLNLRENRLAAISTGTFAGAENLTWLDLLGNELTDLPDGVFSGLSRLTDLLLRDNKLTDLTNHTFDGLPALRILWLAENFLDRLSSDWFSDLPALTALYLNENCLQLTKVPVVGVLEELAVASVSTSDNPRTDRPCTSVGPTVSLFDEGSEGWMAPAATVRWEKAGYMTVGGVGYEYLVSPTVYQGDASAYLGRLLVFRIKQSAAGTPVSGADVIITSGAGLLTYELATQPTTRWDYVKIPLSSSAPWFTATGATATEADLLATLSDVHSINIRWRHSSEPGIVTSIDDVVFGAR